jgi:hypothetical protein
LLVWPECHSQADLDEVSTAVTATVVRPVSWASRAAALPSIRCLQDSNVMRRIFKHRARAARRLAGRGSRDPAGTFEAWLASCGSAAAAAPLTCHPNTVRHRLRRIEQRTNRSLSNPRELTELSLAIHADRRLPLMA